MAWIDQLAGGQLNSKGLKGDLIFDGDWDVLAGSTMRARATLARCNKTLRDFYGVNLKDSTVLLN
jgi:translocation and assembly module TamB